MESLTVKMAQRASKDPALIAYLIDRYSEVENLRWAEVANKLWIDEQRLAKLALCRRPRRSHFLEDARQVAEYMAMDRDQLTSFLRKAETVQAQKSKQQAAAARKPNRLFNARLAWGFVLIVLALVSVGAFLFFMPEPAAATMVVKDGQVTIQTQNKLVSLSAQPFEKQIGAGEVVALQPGDWLFVAPDGSVQLQLMDGSTIELSGGARLQIETLTINDQTRQVRLKLVTGRIISRVQKLLDVGDLFEIITPSSTVSVRGTIFTVQVVSPEVTYVSCDEGIVLVRMGDQEVLVEAGQEVIAEVAKPLEVQPQSDTDGQLPTAVPTTAPTGILQLTPSVVGTPIPVLATQQAANDGGTTPVDTSSTDTTGTDTTSIDDGADNPPPGQGGIPPGQGAEPPGQGDLPPGQR